MLKNRSGKTNLHLLAFYVQAQTVQVLRRRAIPFGATLETDVLNQIIVTYDLLMEQGRRELDTVLTLRERETVLEVLVKHLEEAEERSLEMPVLPELWEAAVAQGSVRPTRVPGVLMGKLHDLSPLASAALVDHARQRCRYYQRRQMKERSKTPGPFVGKVRPATAPHSKTETSPVVDEIATLYRDGRISSSTRSKLKRLGFTTLAQLAATSPEELLKRPNMGPRTIHALRTLLEEHGMIIAGMPWYSSN